MNIAKNNKEIAIKENLKLQHEEYEKRENDTTVKERIICADSKFFETAVFSKDLDEVDKSNFIFSFYFSPMIN